MKAYQIIGEDGIDALALNDIEKPTPKANEVLVRLRASSVNPRDMSTVSNPASRNLNYPRIPNSDGAGEVVAIGTSVTKFKVGDRVCSSLLQSWHRGKIRPADHASGLGVDIDGMLCEYRSMPETGWVHTPAHLTDIEAATLTCTGVTAWHSLVVVGNVKAGDTVLLLGTGGVSISALQICLMLGARVIITSSSDEKLKRASELGAWETINYKTHPNWHEKVLELTNGVGVDHTVEVGGASTLGQSIMATRHAGSIGLIGVLTMGEVNPVMILLKSIRLQGVYCGSREMLENLCRAVEVNKMKPVVDKVYAFEDARQAFHDLGKAEHFGKLVIEI